MRWAWLVLLAACATPPVDLESKFDRRSGWTGADAAYSVDLGDRILWLFGDTWIDRYGPTPKMIRNSIAVQRGEDFDFGIEEFFKPPDGKGWMWPGAGFAARGRVYVFVNQFEEAGRTDGWNFKYMRTWLAVGDATTLKFDYRPIDGSWGVAAVVDGDVAHIFGTIEKPPDRAWRVVSVPLDRLLGDWPAPSSELFRHAGAEGSVSKHGDRFVAIYTELGLSDKILMRIAARPEGPWGEAKVVYTCPEAAWDSTYMCYAAKGHPELSRDGEIVVTYAVNSTDFGKMARDRRIYRPRFIRIPLQGDLQ